MRGACGSGATLVDNTGYARSSGDVVFDPSLPVSDVDAQLNAGTVA